MSARRLAAAGLLALAGCGGDAPLPGEDLALRVVVGATEAIPGRAFPVEVVRTWSKDLVPDAADDRLLSPLVLRWESTSRREDDARVEETRRYRGYAFALEDVTVKPRPFVARPKAGGKARTARAEPVRLRVAPTVDPAAPGPAEPPGDLPEDERPPWPWIAAGLALAVVAAGVIARRRRRPPPAPAIAPPVATATAPPHLEALARLAALRGVVPADEAGQRADVEATAEVVRAYVAARFAVPALERTTPEILAACAGTAWNARLASVLGAADAVKFAGRPPTATSRAALLDEAEAFVRATATGAP